MDCWFYGRRDLHWVVPVLTEDGELLYVAASESGWDMWRQELT